MLPAIASKGATADPFIPSAAFEILRKYDNQVTLKQAEDVLDFLTKSAYLSF